MSHFSVCVITSDGNYEAALAPFDENLEVEEHIAQTKEELIQYQRELNKKRQENKNALLLTDGNHDVSIISVALLDDDLLKQYIEENKDWETFDENGNRLSTCNPNSKWDWYEIGGRFSEQLKLNKDAIPVDLRVKLEKQTVEYNIVISLSTLNLDCIDLENITIDQIQKYLNQLLPIFHPDFYKNVEFDDKYIKQINKIKQMIKDNYANISVFSEFVVFIKSLIALEDKKSQIIKDLLITYKEIDPSIKKYISTWSFGEYKLDCYKVDAAKVKYLDFSANEEKVKYYSRFWEVVVEGLPKTLEEEQDKDRFDTFFNSNYYLDKYRTKENYVEQQTNFNTYACINHGEWFEPGTMGWFGCSDADSDGYKKYEEDFKHILENLDEDDIITVVDCHI